MESRATLWDWLAEQGVTFELVEAVLGQQPKGMIEARRPIMELRRVDAGPHPARLAVSWASCVSAKGTREMAGVTVGGPSSTAVQTAPSTRKRHD